LIDTTPRNGDFIEIISGVRNQVKITASKRDVWYFDYSADSDDLALAFGTKQEIISKLNELINEASAHNRKILYYKSYLSSQEYTDLKDVIKGICHSAAEDNGWVGGVTTFSGNVKAVKGLVAGITVVMKVEGHNDDEGADRVRYWSKEAAEYYSDQNHRTGTVSLGIRPSKAIYPHCVYVRNLDHLRAAAKLITPKMRFMTCRQIANTFMSKGYDVAKIESRQDGGWVKWDKSVSLSCEL
jgi:hypothetical protein